MNRLKQATKKRQTKLTLPQLCIPLNYLDRLTEYKLIFLLTLVLPLFSYGQINDRFLLRDEHLTSNDSFTIKTELIKEKILVSIKLKESVLIKGLLNSKIEPLKVINIASFSEKDFWYRMIGDDDNDSGYLDYENYGNVELTVLGVKDTYKVYIFSLAPPEGTYGAIVMIHINKL